MARQQSSSKKASPKKSQKPASGGQSSARKSGGGALGRLTVGTTVKRMGHPASGGSGISSTANASGSQEGSEKGDSTVFGSLTIMGKTKALRRGGSGEDGGSGTDGGPGKDGGPAKDGSSSWGKLTVLGKETKLGGGGQQPSDDGADSNVIGSIRIGNWETPIRNPFKGKPAAAPSDGGQPGHQWVSAKPTALQQQGQQGQQGQQWVSAKPTALQQQGQQGQQWVSAKPTALQQQGSPQQGNAWVSAKPTAPQDQARARATELELLAEANAMAAATDPSAENLAIANASRLEAQRARARAAAIHGAMRGELAGFKFPRNPTPFSRGSSSLSDDAAREIFSKEKSWPALKAKYASDPATMAGLFAYRKKYVDSLINSMRTRYPNLIANASGSTDLTSDYDVTVSVVGDPKASVEVIATLNETMRSDFGAESGTVFDTNFYYKAVSMKDNILEGGHFPDGMSASDVDGDRVAALSEGEQARPATSSSKEAYDRDQDVLALMKINRYAGDKDWSAFKAETLRSITAKHPPSDGSDPATKEAAARFAAAEQKVAELEEETDARLLSMGFDPNVDPHTLPDAERARFEDARLKANNLAYLDRLAAVADKEGEEAALVQAVADATTKEERDAAWAQLNDVRRDIYALRGDSLYFAAEAYHSTGALVHIVEGIQGGGKINASNELLLQSFNEQFGDFLKDAGHYSDDGEFFYRSAKYAGRMGVAMKDFFMKANGLTSEMLAAAGITVDEAMTGSPSALAALGRPLPFTLTPDQQHAYRMLELMTNNTSKYLLAIRKGVSKDSGPDMQDWYTRLTPEQKKLWAARYADMFAGAKDKRELVNMLRDLAQGFNAAARDFNDSTYAARQPPPPELAAPQPRGEKQQGAAPPGEKKAPFEARAKGSMN